MEAAPTSAEKVACEFMLGIMACPDDEPEVADGAPPPTGGAVPVAGGEPPPVDGVPPWPGCGVGAPMVGDTGAASCV